MVLRPSTLTDIFAVLGIGILCIPLFLMLIPYIEASRSEARIAEAYSRVLELLDSYNAAQPPSEATNKTINSTVELSDIDPWGTPYRVVKLHGNQVCVFSAGPNMKFSTIGTDGDDIYSDMPVSPLALIRARKNRQWLVAIGVTTVAWGVVAALFMRSRRATSS